MNRRHFLRCGLPAAIGSLMGACSSVDRAVIPASLNSNKRPLRVDVHSHIFNGEDVDTYGYFVQGHGHEKVKSYLLAPVRAIAYGLAVGLKLKAPGRHAENRLLENLMDRRAERLKSRGRAVPSEQLFDLLEDDIVDLASTSKSQSKLQRRIDNQKGLEVRTPEVEEKLNNLEKLLADEMEVMRAQGWRGNPLMHPLSALDIIECRDWIGGFLSSISNYRLVNGLNLLRRYPQIDVFVAATLDFDTWFRTKRHGSMRNPSESIAAQSEIMSRICVLTEGKILQRTGFCPLRQLAYDLEKPAEISKWSSVAMLKKACDEEGSVGAKLYPVLGYRAHGNSTLINEDFGTNRSEKAFIKETFGEGHGLGIGLDHALDKLYAACKQGGYSIMAHTNHSHGPDDSAMDRTGPEHWRVMTEKHPDVNVNLGHFGGYDDGFKANAGHYSPRHAEHKEKGWPERICELFATQKNLYADLSFVAPTAHLKELFAQYPEARKRLMYGTDWHELLASFTIKGSESFGYHRRWRELFAKHPDLQSSEADFFGNNAVRFLGLERGKKTRDRLDKFFAKHNVSPEWAKLV